MRKITALLLCIVTAAGMLAGCGQTGVSQSASWTDGLNTAEITDVSDSMKLTEFDDRFLSYIDTRTDGNYMVSPLSFRYALGLLLAGAEGDTEAELLKALGVGSYEEWAQTCEVFNGFAREFDEGLAEELDEYNEGVKEGWIDKNSEQPFRALRVADSVWKREDIGAEFNEDYCEKIEKTYGAEYHAFNPGNAAELINAWVNEKTESMIDELLPDGYDMTDLALVLMNALYFKDAWISSFYEGYSADGDFTTEDGRTVTKTFMTQTEEFAYYADDETQLVILPMKGDVYMAFALGSRDNIDEKISKAEMHSVTVTIPKLDLETSFTEGEFMDFLADNGVEEAFNGDKADFSGMIDYPVYVSDIMQKTRIKLDEEGVEAAAVTAVMMKQAAIMPTEDPIIFTADKPFSFYIYSTANETSAIMFAGRILN